MKYIVDNSIIKTNGKDYVTMEARKEPYTDSAKEVDAVTGDFIRYIPSDLCIGLNNIVCFTEDEENKYDTIMISNWQICENAINLFKSLNRNVILSHKADVLYLTDGIEIAVPIGTTTQTKDSISIDINLLSDYFNAAQTINADTVNIVVNARFIKMACGDIEHTYRIAIKK